MLKSTASPLLLFLLLLPIISRAQDEDWRPSAVRVGADVFGLAKTALTDGYNRQEIQADIDFNKYFFVLDLGREEIDNSAEGFTHTTNGTFYRAGVDVNLTPYNPNKDVVFFGLRYAHATFDESLAFDYAVPYWGSASVDVTNAGLSAYWIEAVFGMKVKVWKQFYMGYTLRGKFGQKTKGAETLIPYTVPGYGVVTDGGNFGFGYHIYYKLAFRDKAVPLRPKDSKKKLK
ncbi:MAG: DUF6048 family protein [Imperialibacter sp.]